MRSNSPPPPLLLLLLLFLLHYSTVKTIHSIQYNTVQKRTMRGYIYIIQDFDFSLLENAKRMNIAPHTLIITHHTLHNIHNTIHITHYTTCITQYTIRNITDFSTEVYFVNVIFVGFIIIILLLLLLYFLGGNCVYFGMNRTMTLLLLGHSFMTIFFPAA